MDTMLLPLSFYQRDPTTVARELLGKILVRNINGVVMSGMIVETESYLAQGDLASHFSRWKTESKKSLYKGAGHAYVYTMHRQNLFNVVTYWDDTPWAILIRAIEPLEGIKFMLENRPVEKITNLTNGPGKLCQALAITRALDGIYLCDEDVEVTLHYGKNIDSAHTITETPRVGITKNVDDLLRFHIKDNEFVSK